MPEEHRAPEQIEPQGLADYLDVLSRAVMQTGISWQVVNKKWPALREAFSGFDAATVAAFGPAEVDALVADPRVIRHRKKIEAIVANAAHMLELDADHGSFRDYLRSHADYDALVVDLRRHFAYLGETGCYFFVYVVGEPVPPYEEWRASREGKLGRRQLRPPAVR
jgi:hypothetical protein